MCRDAARPAVDDERDDATFEISLGGRPFNDVVYFNACRPEKVAQGVERRRGGGADAEAWLRTRQKSGDSLRRLQPMHDLLDPLAARVPQLSRSTALTAVAATSAAVS